MLIRMDRWLLFTMLGLVGIAFPADKTTSQDSSPVLAVVNGRAIHQSEVDERIGSQVYELEQKLYVLRKQATDDMIAAILLEQEAKLQDKTTTELIQSAASRAPAADPDEVNREFSENREALRHLGEAAGRYRVLLDVEANQRTDAVRRYIDDLRSRATVESFLQEPRRDLHLARTPAHLGATGAPVSVVVFLDYDCPFCKKLEPFFTDVLKQPSVASHLDLVIKQFPLPIHPTARHAALASACAALQGKFEPYHTRLLAMTEHTDEAMAQLAAKSGLDSTKLTACMKSEPAKQQVDADIEDARKLGVDATPTIFLNGTKLDTSDPQALLREITARIDSSTKSSKTEVAEGAQ